MNSEDERDYEEEEYNRAALQEQDEMDADTPESDDYAENALYNESNPGIYCPLCGSLWTVIINDDSSISWVCDHSETR